MKNAVYLAGGIIVGMLMSAFLFGGSDEAYQVIAFGRGAN